MKIVFVFVIHYQWLYVFVYKISLFLGKNKNLGRSLLKKTHGRTIKTLMSQHEFEELGCMDVELIGCPWLCFFVPKKLYY